MVIFPIHSKDLAHPSFSYNIAQGPFLVVGAILNVLFERLLKLFFEIFENKYFDFCN